MANIFLQTFHSSTLWESSRGKSDNKQDSGWIKVYEKLSSDEICFVFINFDELFGRHSPSDLSHKANFSVNIFLSLHDRSLKRRFQSIKRSGEKSKTLRWYRALQSTPRASKLSPELSSLLVYDKNKPKLTFFIFKSCLKIPCQPRKRGSGRWFSP
jgi:hypothetical protein